MTSYAVLGDFEAFRGNFSDAAGLFRQAVELAGPESEQALLWKRIQACEEGDAVDGRGGAYVQSQT